VHIGTLFSAYFILAANSWMQHPVGYVYNPETGRAEMNDFAAVLFNKVQLVTFPHVVLSAYLTGATLVVGVAFWHIVRGRPEDAALYRLALRTGAAVALVSALLVAISGDTQAKVMTEVQPMKMAAAEALYDGQDSAPFSLFTIGSLDGTEEVFAIKVPGLLSFLATGSTSGHVEGINDLREEYIQTYGQDPGAAYYSPGDYTPPIAVSYWSFRLMIGLGLLAAAIAGWILFATRRGRLPRGRTIMAAAIALPLLPLLANSFGWIFTELGRQPWAVFGLMTTAHGVSPGVSTAEALTSLLALTLLYGVLAVVEVRLMLTYIARGADPLPVEPSDDSGTNDPDKPLAFAY
jgi:cytochrome d ubiquinol oxidase subunit I